MKKDLKNTTFIIPIRIESEDRLRNVITICCFLLDNFDTKIIIKEVDKTSVFKERALPQISEFVEDSISNLRHVFEKADPIDPTFYRMRYINEMINMCDTEVIGNYDCDVLLPVSTYIKVQDLIVNDGVDVVYPYGLGIYVKKVTTTDEMVSNFLINDSDFSYLEKQIVPDNAHSGHCQFFKRSSYIEAGMENENFKSWGPEDKERLHRFTTLGYNVTRVEDYVYHLEHARGQDSYYNNPFHTDNCKLWEHLQGLSPDDLRNYYSSQKYLKKYK